MNEDEGAVQRPDGELFEVVDWRRGDRQFLGRPGEPGEVVMASSGEYDWNMSISTPRGTAAFCRELCEIKDIKRKVLEFEVLQFLHFYATKLVNPHWPDWVLTAIFFCLDQINFHAGLTSQKLYTICLRPWISRDGDVGPPAGIPNVLVAQALSAAFIGKVSTGVLEAGHLTFRSSATKTEASSSLKNNAPAGI